MEIPELVKEAVGRAAHLFQSGRCTLAEEMYRQVLRVDSSNLDAINMLPLVVASNGRAEEAEILAKEAVHRSPRNFQLYNNLGMILGTLNKHDEAIICFIKATDLQPEASFVFSNMALEYKRVGNHALALRTFENAIKNGCEHAYFNYGAYLDEIGKQDQAIKYYEEAVKINPEFAVAHYNLASDYLLLGNFEQGWKEYEWRWKAYPQFGRVRDGFGKPTWNGEKDKKVLFFCEQGAGDLIQFMRYLPLVKAKKVYLECQPDIRGIVDAETEYEDFDCQYSLLDLPKMFGIYWNGSYVKSSGVASNEWDKYGFKVGIAWAGNPRHPNDARRSRWLKDFEALVMPGVSLFSLQKDLRKRYWPNSGEVDLTLGANLPLVDLSEHLVDFNALANCIEQMDLIITVDTAIAHLAGAMDKPVWVLLPKPCDWRWLLSGDRTPWYPSMRLFRGSIEEVRRKLSLILPKVTSSK